MKVLAYDAQGRQVFSGDVDYVSKWLVFGPFSALAGQRFRLAYLFDTFAMYYYEGEV